MLVLVLVAFVTMLSISIMRHMVRAFLLVWIERVHLTTLLFQKIKTGKDSSTLTVPSGPRPWPIVGNLLQLGFRPHETLYHWSKTSRYGSIFRLRLGSEVVVVLNSPSIIREALHDHGETFAGRPYLHMIHETLRGKGVISAPYGREFNEHKNFLIKSFNRFGRRRRSSLENGCLDEVRFVAERLREKQSSPFGFSNLLSQIACNNICTLTFGRYFETMNMNNLFDKISENFNQTATIACFNFLPFTRRFRKNIFENVQDCNRVIQKLVGERETNFDSEFISNIVDAYLDEMNEPSQRSTFFSKENLDSLVQDLFVAGTETVSNTLNWTIFYIVAHSEVQKNVHEEIDQMIGKERTPCDKDRSRMPYIEAVLLESMRCHCAGPILLPRATTQDITFRDYFIPKDTFILVNMWSAMQDEQHWSEPEKFQPERFLDEDRSLRNVNHPAMMPFSVGKRACTGEKLHMKRDHSSDAPLLFKENKSRKFNCFSFWSVCSKSLNFVLLTTGALRISVVNPALPFVHPTVNMKPLCDKQNFKKKIVRKSKHSSSRFHLSARFSIASMFLVVWC